MFNFAFKTSTVLLPQSLTPEQSLLKYSKSTTVDKAIGKK